MPSAQHLATVAFSVSKRWRLVVSDLGGDTVQAEVAVDADNWMAALRKGREQMGETGGVPTGSSCGVAPDGKVTILDPMARRRMTLILDTSESFSKSRPKGPQIPADPVPRPQSNPPPPSAAAQAPVHTPSSPPAPKVGRETMAYVPPTPAGLSPPKKKRKKKAMTMAYIPQSAIPEQAKEVVVGSGAPKPVEVFKPSAATVAAPAKSSPAPVAKPVPAAPVAKPVPAAPVAKPVPAAPVAKPVPAAPVPAAPVPAAPVPAAPVPAAPVPAAPVAQAPAAHGSAAPAAAAAQAPAAQDAPAPERISETQPRPSQVPTEHVDGVDPEGGTPWKLSKQRDQSPTAENPLWYRERIYTVPEGTSGDVSERIALGRISELKRLLENQPPGKFLNVAVFDHEWAERPVRPPVVTAMFKDWQGDVVVDRPMARLTPAPSAPPPAAPVGRKAQRTSTDEHDRRLADAFEACQDLFFLGSAQEALDFAINLLEQLLPAEAASACLYDIDSDVFRFVVVRGTGAEHRQGHAVPSHMGVFSAAVKLAPQPLRLESLAADARFDPEADGRPGLECRSALYLPVTFEGRMLGMLQLVNRVKYDAFTQADADLGVYIAEQLGKFVYKTRIRAQG